MSLVTAIIGLLVLAALLGILRSLRRSRVGAVWVILGHVAAATLLYLVLFPPTREAGSETLVVLTPGYVAENGELSAAEARGVALPGVEANDAIERVPDLATALRRHPRVGRLQIRGGGLPMRDQDAAAALPLDFMPAEPPPGVIELNAPERVVAGSIWRLTGRVAGVPGGKLELRDRADAVVASATLGADGRFTLDVRAKTSGRVTYPLRLLAADDRVIEETPVAQDVGDGDRLRVLLVAGAPDAELKYLRRWAVDAGIDLRTKMAISRGISLGEGEAKLDADALQQADLLIVDERAWSALPKVTRDEVLSAVDAGLGLMLRVTGPVPAAVVAEWATIGFRLERADVAQSVSLGVLDAPSRDRIEVTRRPIAVDARDGVALVRAADGTSLASWRARGRGRVALWWLADTYRIVIGGDAQRHGALWSDAAATLARPRATNALQLPRHARVNERAVACGLAADAYVEDDAHARTALVVDPSTKGCAAFWPAHAGWHTVVDREARRSLFVLADDQGVALARESSRQATRELAASANSTERSLHRVDLPRWPFFLAWLLVMTLLWWRERRAAAVLST